MAFLRLRNLSVEFSLYQGASRSLKKSLIAKPNWGTLRAILDIAEVFWP
jgi:hypothetical protein